MLHFTDKAVRVDTRLPPNDEISGQVAWSEVRWLFVEASTVLVLSPQYLIALASSIAALILHSIPHLFVVPSGIGDLVKHVLICA